MRGKSWEPPDAKALGRDHPRPCGEKSMRMCVHLRAQGSPPPMRGKVEQQVDNLAENGITPAHAGKSCSITRGCAQTQDHPRPCGEKLCSGCCCSASSGSPPPMRGKGGRDHHSLACGGITPAHAGKSAIREEAKAEGAGSPPPMRGKVSLRRCFTFWRRITPAHAGKRSAAQAAV